MAEPSHDSHLTAKENVVAWDGPSGTLRKTARLGASDVMFAERLHRRDVLLELQLESLPTVGGIWLGVMIFKHENENPCGQRWCDGTGRVHARDEDGTYNVGLCGERVREGDVLGVCWLPSTGQVGFTLDGVLMGAPLPLPAGRFFAHFYTRLDCVEGTQARIVRRRNAPLDRRALLASAEAFVPRPLGDSPPTVLVRTVGPDSHYHAIAVDPDRASVLELHEKVLEALGIDSWRAIELRVSRAVSPSGSGVARRTSPSDGRTRSSSNVTGTRALNGPYACGEMASTMLAECDLGYDKKTGCQLCDIIVSEPHLIS